MSTVKVKPTTEYPPCHPIVSNAQVRCLMKGYGFRPKCYLMVFGTSRQSGKIEKTKSLFEEPEMPINPSLKKIYKSC